MGKDVGWKGFFSDNERYADVINGIGCNGMQVVQKEDLHELDTQAWDIKTRDCVRKVAYGINFAIIGIENQDTVDYSIPLRSALYDVGMYEKQATKIRKEVRANHEGLSAGEYLYGF